MMNERDKNCEYIFFELWLSTAGPDLQNNIELIKKSRPWDSRIVSPYFHSTSIHYYHVRKKKITHFGIHFENLVKYKILRDLKS